MNLNRRICLLLLALIPFGAWAESVLVDGVAAQVNAHSIMISDAKAVVEAQSQKLNRAYDGEELKVQLRKAYEDAVNLLIERQLILDSYEALGKEQTDRQIPDQFVNERMNGVIRDMFKGDRAEAMSALEKEGMSLEEWRNEIKNQIVVASMRKANVEQNVKISPQAIRDFYNKNMGKYKLPARIKLRMIVLSKGASTEEAGQELKQAEDIRKKIRDGEDFAALAKQFSKDSKAEQGVDWGWIEPGILASDLAKVASSMREGEVSDTLKVENEFYILKCEGLRQQETLSFEEVQPQIEKELRQEEAKHFYAAWIDRLKKSASIKVFDTQPY